MTSRTVIVGAGIAGVSAAGAIYQNSDYLRNVKPDLVLILSADHIYKMDYSKLIQFHSDNKADVTVATLRVSVEEASRWSSPWPSRADLCGSRGAARRVISLSLLVGSSLEPALASPARRPARLPTRPPQAARHTMHIRKLELLGFKSFPDKTTFHFDAGVSGVVGPNGCGKSNVVDGVMWCLGEQSPRALRGRSMEDVIFAGSADRPPMGVAEVSITFEAGESPFPGDWARHSEIEISRRLYRDGHSEYYLNQQRVRLRDIHDLFLDTGVSNRMYSVIEQGRIGEIVNARPEQRRTLIEEAADRVRSADPCTVARNRVCRPRCHRLSRRAAAARKSARRPTRRARNRRASARGSGPGWLAEGPTPAAGSPSQAPRTRRSPS